MDQRRTLTPTHQTTEIFQTLKLVTETEDMEGSDMMSSPHLQQAAHQQQLTHQHLMAQQHHEGQIQSPDHRNHSGMSEDYEVQTGFQGGPTGPGSSVAPSRTPRPGVLTQIITKVPMNLKLKSLEDRKKKMTMPEAYPDFCCPIVNKTHFIQSGPILRILNNGLPGVPHELTTLRLPHLFEESIPRFFYCNMASLKDHAVKHILEIAKENGSNFADDPKINVRCFTARISVSTLHPEAKAALNNTEAGLWVFHYPNMLQPYRGRDYSDGSSETFHIINMHVNLIAPSFRLYVPEGGWNPPKEKPTTTQPYFRRDEGPMEKRPRGMGMPPRMMQYAENASIAASNLLEDTKKTIEDLKKTATALQQPAFPELPKGHADPGGVTPWLAADDCPKFV